MDKTSFEFNKQLELDVLVNNLSKITQAYVKRFDRYYLTDVIIPEGVKSIRDWTFYNCSGLTSITIPDSVTSIGGRAFAWCSGLTSVTIPNSVTSIGYDAFWNCSGLTRVTFEGKTLDEVRCMEYYPWGISLTTSVQVA